MVAAVIDIAVNGILLAGDALGSTLTTQSGSAHIDLYLPTADGTLPSWDQHGVDEGWALGQQAWRQDETTWAQVLTLRTVVRLPEVIQAEELASGQPHDEEVLARALSVAAEAMRLATHAVGSLVEQVRVMGQPWLGLNKQEPTIVAGPSLYDDRDPRAPVRLAVSTGPTIEMIAYRDSSAMAAGALTSAWEAACRGEEPRLADIILADAQHLLRDAPTTLRQVLLLAAVASEVRISTRCNSSPQPSRRPSSACC